MGATNEVARLTVAPSSSGYSPQNRILRMDYAAVGSHMGSICSKEEASVTNPGFLKM